MPLTLNPPPPTPIEPVTEVLHGVSITDPYRWLEDQNSQRTREWLEEQAVYTRRYLDAIPARNWIQRRVEELLTVETISELYQVGGRYFYTKRSGYQEQPIILMRESDSHSETVLVDPARRPNSTRTAVKIQNISKDGTLLAYGVSNGADSSRSVEFLDVDRMEVLPDRLPQSLDVQVQLSPDRRGFYYSCRVIDTQRPYNRAAYWHQFGTKPQEDVEVFFAGESDKIYLRLLGPTDSDHLGYLVSRANEFTAFDLFIQDVSRKKPPIKILEQIRPVFQPFFVGNRLFALTDWNAPHLRLVSIDLYNPGCNNWVDVIPESQHSIKNVAFIGNSVCIYYVENASSRIEVFDQKGRWQGTVPCPPQGSAQPLCQLLEHETLLYKFSSFRHRPTIFSYHIPSGEQTVWEKSPLNFHPSSIQVEQIRYKSKDGTEIPMYLVSQKDRWRPGPVPTFLGAYGGFGISRTPQFNAYSTFLIEHGFLFAFANVRGGGEFGEEWHRAAKGHNRQNAFDDFIAAAEWLIAKGYTVPGKIAIGGGSNAGLLVGAALTQRPDLFRAVVCMGPLLDMLRFHRFDTAHMFIDEYGTPEREDDFLHLQAYSPYHSVKDGVRYPAVMLVSGDEDTCCNPMHARKMAARLQATTSSGLPVLLDYKPTWGHAPLQPLTRRIEALTDRLAFICNELGVGV